MWVAVLWILGCNENVCTLTRGGLAHPIVKRHEDCQCTSPTQCFSHGVDVRPRCGCQDFNEEGYHYCYTQGACPGSFQSSGFPGATFRPCLSPSPPPPAPDSCNDPLFPLQWHLTLMNVLPAWSISRGAGTYVAVLDDGVQYSHPDLRVNRSLSFGWNFETGARLSSANDANSLHGTATAGLVSSIANNDRGGCGVAHDTRLIAVKILTTGEVTSSTIALSDDIFINSLSELSRLKKLVVSNSWGPPDDGRVDGPGHRAWYRLVDDAIRSFAKSGNVMVFASGNGGQFDNSNDDGFASHLDTITVGSVGDDMHKTSYSEPGTNIDVVAPSDGGWRSITTTDIVGDLGYGPGNSTDTFGGTSASTPLVSGVISLLFSVQPTLTARDIRLILWDTSSKIDPQSNEWVTNNRGVATHPFYGHGMINAAAAISAAMNWEARSHFREECSTTWFGFLPTVYDSWTEIPYNDLKVSFEEVEQVVVFVDVDHPWRGDVVLRLVSPSGTVIPFTFFVPTSVPLRDTFFVPHNYTINGFYKESSTPVGWKLQVRDVSSRGRLRQTKLCVRGVPIPTPPVPPASPPPPPVFAIAPPQPSSPRFHDSNGNSRVLRAVVWTVSSFLLCIACILCVASRRTQRRENDDDSHDGRPAAEPASQDGVHD